MLHALDEVGQLTDSELVGRLERLVKADRALSAKLLVHLGEVEARGLHCERGFSSMFEYCRDGLGMTDAEAFLRLQAARVGRRFPLVVERLGAGAVNLSAIKLLAPLLTESNHEQLLERVRGLTKRQIEVLVADLAPKPDVSARMRKVPEKRALVEASAAATIPAPGGAALMFATSNTAANPAPCSAALTSIPAAISAPLSAAMFSSTTAQPSASHAGARAPSSTFTLESPRARATSTPLGLGRFKLQLTLGQEAHDALEQLVELFRHQNPTGDFTPIVERALTELLKREMKRRFAQLDAGQPRVTSKPAQAKAAQPRVTGEPAPTDEAQLQAMSEPAGAELYVEAKAEAESKLSSSNSRYIRRKVMREVYGRDEGQCSYVSPEGRRCTARGFLQVHHHDTTYARGGEATADNLRITCRAHNLFYAERDYGRAYMQRKLREAAARKQLSLVPGREQS